MSEEPQSIWKKSWKGPRAYFLFGLLVVAPATLFALLATDSLSETRGMVLAITAVLGGIGIALAAFLAVQFIRWLCRWRNLKRVLFGIACFITLIALVVTEENWRAKRAWEKFKREWEAKGERFDLSTFVPASVPDAQNYAMTPLLRPIYNYTYGTNGVRWLDTNGLNRLQKIGAERPPHRDTNDHLVLGSLELGTLADVEACRNFYRGNTNYPQPVTSGTAAEDILVALSKFDSEMQELHEAAVTRPFSRFPIHYEYEPPENILLPHLSYIKGLVSLFRMRAVAWVEAGQNQNALEDLKLGFRLSEAIREEPILIDHLVRLATLSICLQGVREGLVRHAWSDAQLVDLEKYLGSLDLLAEFRQSMRGERALNVGGLDYMRRQRFKFNGGNFMPDGWLYQNMLRISRLHQSYSIASVDEQRHRAFPDICADGEKALEKMRAMPYNVLAKLLFPALNKSARKSSRMQTYVDAARIACALERYRLANGQLPDTLDSLVPRFIDKIPNDVIDGKPLRYRRTPDHGYLIYSVGWNKTDDGGEVVLPKVGSVEWEKKRGSVDMEKGDWVWRLPAK